MRLPVTLAPILALLALLALTTTAIAGSSATVTLDGDGDQPSAGQPIEIGFTLYQHGVRPVSWPDAWITATNPETGQTVTADAVPQGAEGHYVATITLPSKGTWTWAIETHDLEVLTAMEPMVATSPGSASAVGTASPAASTALVPLVAIAGALGVIVVAGATFAHRRRPRPSERQVAARA